VRSASQQVGRFAGGVGPPTLGVVPMSEYGGDMDQYRAFAGDSDTAATKPSLWPLWVGVGVVVVAFLVWVLLRPADSLTR